jgi:hypothetical protein
MPIRGSFCVPIDTQIIHVEVAMLLEPVLVGLDGERAHQPQAASLLGKMRTTWVRSLVSSLRRSSMLVDLRCF